MMKKSNDGVIGSQRNQYEQLENIRGQALQQELQIQQQFYSEDIAASAVKQMGTTGDNIDTEVVAGLLLRTDTLIIKALRIPSDTTGDLTQYPQLVLDLEERITKAQTNTEIEDLGLELRRLEVEFNQKSLENLTRIVKKEQRVRDVATKWIIPGIIVFYLFLTIFSFLAFFNDDTLGFFNIPISVLMAGLLGGVTALFLRYRRVTPSRLTSNDIVWFMTKPIIGLLMAGLAYGAILAGFFAFQAEVPEDAQLWPFWITAWAVGFSDWFFDTFIVQILGRISGEDDPDALNEFDETSVLTDAEIRNREFQELVAERNASLVKSLQDVLDRQQSRVTTTEVEILTPTTPELSSSSPRVDDVVENEAEIIEEVIEPTTPPASSNPTSPSMPADTSESSVGEQPSIRTTTTFADESAG